MSDPPEPIQEDFEAPMGDPQEISAEELDEFMNEPAEEDDLGCSYSDIMRILDAPDEPDQGPEADDVLQLRLDRWTAALEAEVVPMEPVVVEIPEGERVEPQLELAPAAPVGAVVKEIPEGERVVEPQLELLPAAPMGAVVEEIPEGERVDGLQQEHAHAVAPFGLATDKAPMHGPQMSFAQMKQKEIVVLDSGAVDATQTAPHDLVVGPVHREPYTCSEATMTLLTSENTCDGKDDLQTYQQSDMPQDGRELEPYSEATVARFISQNEWDGLETYLLSYIPQDGSELTLQHAHLFLRCRKSSLLTILNGVPCDLEKAEAYMESNIVPLGAARSKYVNSEQLIQEIELLREFLHKRLTISNIGVQDYVKDYMDFHFPNITRYNCGRTAAWHFIAKIIGESSMAKGTVLARCKLCQIRLSAQNSVRRSVVRHIGGRNRKYLTEYSLELYNAAIGGVQLKHNNDTKLPTSDESGRASKRRKLDTVASVTNTQGGDKIGATAAAVLPQGGGYLLRQITSSLDDVSSSVGDLCVMSNARNKENVKCRIQSTIEGIKASVNQLVAETAARTLAGIKVKDLLAGASQEEDLEQN